MRRMALRAGLAGLLALAPFTAAVALASVSSVSGTVEVWHGTDLVASYTGSAACTPVSNPDACAVSVTMPNRDSGRFNRWCGASSAVVTVWAGLSTNQQVCPGSSSWSVVVTATMYDGTSSSTYPGDVSVTVSAP